MESALAEAEANGLRQAGVRQLIEAELLALLDEQREGLLDRVAEALLERSAGDFHQARSAAAASLEEVQHLLLNHAEAVG